VFLSLLRSTMARRRGSCKKHQGLNFTEFPPGSLVVEARCPLRRDLRFLWP
jgi:hypothetical protein